MTSMATDSNTNNTTTPCNCQKKYMVYNKEHVLEKLDDTLECILKYFKACFDKNLNKIQSMHTNYYLQTRIQNVHNLLASLMFNDEITYEEYYDWIKVHEKVEQEFSKPIEEIKCEERANLLQKYIDSIMELSIYKDQDVDEESEEENEEEIDENDEISDLDEAKIPDNASIINVNSDCKKRKM